MDHKNNNSELGGSKNYDRLILLLKFEGQIRRCKNLQEFGFHLVNELRFLVNYRQAFLLHGDRSGSGGCKLLSASSLSSFDPNAPFVRWLESATKHFDRNLLCGGEVVRFTIEDCPEAMKEGWKEFSMPYVAWCSLRSIQGVFLGGLWLVRETPWSDTEISFLNRIAETAAYSVGLLSKPKTWRPSLRWAGVLGFALMFLSFLVPVRLSVLAPVEVVADSPMIISSPIDAVIETIVLQPNTEVESGEILFTLDDTELRNAVEISRKQLLVKQVQYRTATQSSFSNKDSKAKLTILKEEIDLAQVELAYHVDRMRQINVKAPRKGVVIYGDSSDWVGKPVRVGERVMEVADPAKVKLRIDIPVSDAIVLREGADVEIFLNSDPLNPFRARLEKISYQAREIPGGILAYKAIASVGDGSQTELRIGFRGTAKVFGETVSLIFYIFRRPFSVFRQFTGL